MVKRKDRPVLFEIVHRKEPRIGGAARPRPRPRINRPGGRTVAAPKPSAGEPLLRLLNGRVRINTGWLGLSAAALGLVLLLAIAFEAGARYADGGWSKAASPDAELDRLLAGPAEPSVLSVPDAEKRNGTRKIATPPLARSQDSTAPPPTSVEPRGEAAPATSTPMAAREKGAHYIIVQYVPNSRVAAAQTAARFLTDHGVPAGVDTSGPDVRVVASEAFRIDQGDSAAAAAEQRRCDALKKQIRELGKQYMRDGGGYSFEGCKEQKQ